MVVAAGGHVPSSGGTNNTAMCTNWNGTQIRLAAWKGGKEGGGRGKENRKKQSTPQLSASLSSFLCPKRWQLCSTNRNRNKKGIRFFFRLHLSLSLSLSLSLALSLSLSFAVQCSLLLLLLLSETLDSILPSLLASLSVFLVCFLPSSL